jgi:hypothetical protein
MGLTMGQKRAVTGRLAKKYRGSKSKRERSRILDEVRELTCSNRHYAAWLLRNYGTHRIVTDEQGQSVGLVVGRKKNARDTERPPTYDEAVRKEIVLAVNVFGVLRGYWTVPHPFGDGGPCDNEY